MSADTLVLIQSCRAALTHSTKEIEFWARLDNAKLTAALAGAMQTQIAVQGLIRSYHHLPVKARYT